MLGAPELAVRRLPWLVRAIFFGLSFKVFLDGMSDLVGLVLLSTGLIIFVGEVSERFEKTCCRRRLLWLTFRGHICKGIAR